MLTAAVWGVVAFALSAVLTLLCMPLARLLGAVARPRNDRWHRVEQMNLQRLSQQELQDFRRQQLDDGRSQDLLRNLPRPEYTVR